MSYVPRSLPSPRHLAAVGLLLILELASACSHDRALRTATQLGSQRGYIPVPGGRIWYEVVGSGPGTPLLLIHGGPGSRSCRLAALKALGSDRPVIFYDQLGTGRSDRPTDTTLWRLPRFLDEIDSIRVRLRLSQLHLYGHSWGATVATEYFLSRHPAAVRSITLAGPLLSTSRWIGDANTLRAQLPQRLQQVLLRHEREGTIDAPDYQAATDSFYARYLSRRRPAANYPECQGVKGNDAVYRYMWGPTEFRATGTLRDLDVTSRLAELDRPVLLLAGEFDEARPQTVREFQHLIPGARFELIPGAGHAITIDEPERVIHALRSFLRDVDAH